MKIIREDGADALRLCSPDLEAQHVWELLDVDGNEVYQSAPVGVEYLGCSYVEGYNAVATTACAGGVCKPVPMSGSAYVYGMVQFLVYIAIVYAVVFVIAWPVNIILSSIGSWRLKPFKLAFWASVGFFLFYMFKLFV